MNCPKCKDAPLTTTGQHMGCAQCGGLFVTEASFNDMLATMSSGSDTVRSIASYPIGTQWCVHLCPECSDTMMSSSLEQLAVERCAQHGIWFDKTELERALSKNAVAQAGIADENEDALGRAAELAVGVTVGGALALLVRYISRVMR